MAVAGELGGSWRTKRRLKNMRQ